MAVITYECDTCNRIIEFVEMQESLEIVQRCNITQGCRGKLFRINRKIDHIRGEFPNRVAGLTDWSQRKVLFNYSQNIELTEWIVSHNLGVIPTVQVLVNRPLPIPLGVDISTIDLSTLIQQVEITPLSIETIDLNTTKITFDRPESGRAQFISAVSAQTLDIITNTIATEEESLFQLTVNQDLTLATLNTDPLVTIRLTFITPGDIPVNLLYNVDNTVSTQSPWTANNIFVEGNSYIVRNFDFIENNSQFNNNAIPFGSTFTISEINGNPLTQDDILILLTNPPHAPQDIILDNIINPYNITNASNLIYNTRNLFASPIIINNIFPHILEI